MPTIAMTVDGETVQGGDRVFATVAEYEMSVCWRLVRSVWHRRYSDRHEGKPAGCEVCGKTDPLELHHLAYDALGFDDSRGVLDRLVPLCTWHHYEVEKRIGQGAPRATAHSTLRRVPPRGPRWQQIGAYMVPTSGTQEL